MAKESFKELRELCEKNPLPPDLIMRKPAARP